MRSSKEIALRNNKAIRHGRHCVFGLHVHLVFVAKYRKRVFTKTTMTALHGIFIGVCKDFEAELVEFNGETDHVHLLVNYPPKVAVAKLVNSLKGVSSRLLWKEHPEIRKRMWGNALWSPSYFAGSCGGAPLAIIKRYIDKQNTPN